MQRIITRWIVDLKLDGFMFDAPDAELGAGIDGAAHSKYNPALIRESMSDVIHNASGGRAASFAEIYSDPPLMDISIWTANSRTTSSAHSTAVRPTSTFSLATHFPIHR